MCDFIGGVAVAATQHAQLRTGVPKLSTEDVIGVVRKDAARLTRAKELVTANEETRKALKVAQPDNKDLAELGKSCEEAGLIDEARGWYTLAITMNPLDGDAQQSLARLGKVPGPTPGN